MKFKSYFRAIFVVVLISLSAKSYSATTEYVAIPHYTANSVEFRNTVSTNTAGTLYFANEGSLFNFPFNAYGPNATAIWKNYFFVSFDNGSSGGVLIYKYSDLFDSTGSYRRNTNPPIVLNTNAPTCGLVVDQITGDLFVATFRSGSVTGKVTRYTKASNWNASSAFVLPIPNNLGVTFLGLPAGLAIDHQGNIWVSIADQHCLICYRKSTNYDHFYYVVNGNNNFYNATKATGTGPATLSMKLFSGPEGLALDPDGGIWFANNNDFGPQNTDGTFGKIKAAYIPTLLALPPSGTRIDPAVANFYTVPQNMVEVLSYITGAKFGGIAYNRPESANSPYGVFINDQGSDSLWYWKNLTNFTAFGKVTITTPGFGGISLNSGNFEFVITQGMHKRRAAINGNVSITRATPGNLWLAMWGSGVLRSTNFGWNFTPTTSGLTNLNIRTLFSVGTTLFAGTQGGAFITSNNGANWTAINTGLTNTDITAFAGGGSNLFAGTAGGVFTSVNNGTTWTAVNSGLTNTNITTLVSSGSVLYAGTTTGGVFRSSNNGASWTSVNSNLANLNIRSLQISGANLFAGTTTGVYFTSNNGTSWSSVSNGLPSSTPVLSFALTGSNIFAGTEAGLFYSTNNGQSWIDKNQGYTSTMAVNSILISDGYLYTGTNDGLWARDLTESVLISQISSEIPAGFSLSQNYPNPFNPTTVIGFQIPAAGFISLKIYDINGKELSELVNENLKAGEYKVNFDGKSLPSGIYFYKLATDNFTQTKKMLLVK